MRIIAGQHRGRRILGPRDASTTRPITDRAKQSLFDRLWSLGLLPDDPDDPQQHAGLVLDIFAGTGSLGLEALSRGAARCLFVEQDREALQRLQRNLQTLDLASRARILKINALRPGWLMHEVREPARIVFVDPPYAMLHEAGGWDRLANLLVPLADVTEPAGVMMVRTPKRTEPTSLPGWDGPDTRRHGTTLVHLYQRPTDTREP